MTQLMRLREAMADTTPMRTDCGRLCGSACCSSMEGEETGMLLFPGQEGIYNRLDGYQVKDGSNGKIVICSGTCSRSERPISCRIFPLLPVLRQDGIHVVTDERARAVCPMAQQGKAAMHPDFVQAVEQVGIILNETAQGRAFLRQLTDTQDELRLWRRQLTGR